jgi:hypothetical protein
MITLWNELGGTMHISNLFGLTAFIIALILPPPADTAAATIEFKPTEHCSFHLRGPIMEGDAARLKAAMEQQNTAMGDLCLEGPGGSFAEANRIIDYILSSNLIGTVVGKDAECYAACAYVFMAGRQTFENLTFPKRRLHVRATLAFLPPQGTGAAEANQEALQRSFQEAVRALGALAKFNGSHTEGTGRDADFPYPRSLIAEIVQSGPSRQVVVDSLALAHKWHITLLGFHLPTNLTKRDLHRACLAEAAEWPERSAGKAVDQVIGDDIVSIAPGKTIRTVFTAFGRASNEICVADLYHSPKTGLHINISFGKNLRDKSIMNVTHLFELDKESDNMDDNTPIWRTLPMETKFEAIGGR